ncbi:MAG: alpha/beta hydrolase fold domain-containing protein, partial [Paracoccaceae bacterium]
MDPRLFFLNLLLRLTVKRKLRRLDDPEMLRRLMERDAARNLRPPEDAHFVEDLMRRPGQPRKVGMIDALWASCGRPDRRKVALHFHGGAYLAGSPRTHKSLGAALAKAAGVRVVLPKYRLAPEHPFPAGLNDALAAYRHLLSAGYTPEEIAIGGDSAGGGLAFALSLRLQGEGEPQPACLYALSPWADLTGNAASIRRNATRDVMLPAPRMAEVARL